MYKRQIEHCGECRKYLEQCLREVQVPVEPPAQETDKKIIRGMRFRLIWCLFWPSLYAVCLQFGKEGTLRFFGIALILTAWITIGTHHYEYNFDLDDTKREFYQREEKSIREHKGTFPVSYTHLRSMPEIPPLPQPGPRPQAF